MEAGLRGRKWGVSSSTVNKITALLPWESPRLLSTLPPRSPAATPRPAVSQADTGSQDRCLAVSECGPSPTRHGTTRHLFSKNHSLSVSVSD